MVLIFLRLADLPDVTFPFVSISRPGVAGLGKLIAAANILEVMLN